MDTIEKLETVDQDHRLASDAVHPFSVHFSDAELADMRRRISATRRYKNSHAIGRRSTTGAKSRRG
jgi:hypothetical protein